MVATKQVKLEVFHITQSDGNITAGNGTANLWSDIWKYQVPQGVGLILQAGDTLSAYLAAAGPTEISKYLSYVKLEVRDPSEQDIVRVYGPALYQKLVEFQDRTLLARLNVLKPEKVYSRQWIVLSLKSTSTTLAALSYFDLVTSKAAVPIL